MIGLKFNITALRISFAFLIISLALSVGPSGSSAKVFDPEVFVLDNGMTVVVVTNRRAPIVTHMVWYKVGAADEAPGESGLAHFLEHLMFKGTDSLGPGEFSEIIAENGGRENAFTSWDFTGYFQTVAADRLAIVMEHEADRMTGLKLSDELVLPEREVVREERRSRVENDPSAQLNEMIMASLFLNHPYRVPVIGWDHEISDLSTENALSFYRKWYAPNNAILIIAGDVDAEEVRPLAEKYYGVIPRKEVPQRLRPVEPPQRAERRVTLRSDRVNQPSLSIRYLAPSYRTAEGNEAYSLQIFEEIMTGGASSRLYRSLVVDQGIAAGAGAGYGPDRYDETQFLFYVSPRPGRDLEEAEAALRTEIERAISEGVTAEEVESAKRRLAASAIFARDPLGAAPNIIGRALTTGRTIEELEAWPERIEAVTVEDVNAAARALVDETRSVTGVLLPEPTT